MKSVVSNVCIGWVSLHAFLNATMMSNATEFRLCNFSKEESTSSIPSLLAGESDSPS